MKKTAMAIILATACGANAAETTFKKEVASKGLKNIEVNTASADVGFSAASGAVRITATQYDEAKCRLEIDESGAALRVRLSSVDRYGWKIFRLDSGCRANLEITAPEQTALKIKTASGSAAVKGLRAKLDIDTASGDVRLDNADGPAKIETASGSIAVAGLKEALEAVTASGNVRIDGARGAVKIKTASGSISGELYSLAELETASGDISLRWPQTPGKGEISFHTASGNAKLIFPQGTKLDADFDSLSGESANAFPSADGKGLQVRGHSASGDLRIEAADSASSAKTAG
ncbi:MAG: DUF4097 family beta strand repeat-containing protein [Elusimicrobiales bacterium]|nr:DUF4097 family beta strand repeat-containing protein [Elusimicrobiales bacterium]